MSPRPDALNGPFPAGPEWAAAARDRLGLAPGDRSVLSAAQGWMRLGSTRDGMLVDTLFVLTSTRLGFGQTRFETTDPNWVDLAMVKAIDLIEGVPYPLDAVELQFVNGLAIFVGWPSNFVADVLAALGAMGAAPTMPPLFGAGTTETPPASTPKSPPPPVPPSPAAASAPAPAASAPEVAPEVRPATVPLPEMFAVDEPDEDREQAAEEFFRHLEGEEHPMTGSVPVVAAARGDGSAPGPWNDAELSWPEAFEDVAFLGGHPVHQRRRKSATLLLDPAGILATTPRAGWQLQVPWVEVARLDVQGADEIKFTHNHRVSSDSSVLVVQLTDDTSLLFEVRRKSPATVRGAVAQIRDVLERHRGESA